MDPASANVATVTSTVPAQSLANQIGLQAGAQIGQGILGYLGQRRQNKHNIQLMKDAQAHELSMWQMQMDYNNPKNQMQRLIDAGLNPHLIYGKPSEAAGNAGSKPQTFVPQVENELRDFQLPMAMDLLQQVQQYKNMKNQSSLMDEQKSNLAARTLKTIEDHYTSELENKRRLLSMEMDLQRLEALKNSAKHYAEKLKYEAMLKKTESELQEHLRQYGFTQSDHVGIRALVQLLNALGIDLFNFNNFRK